jgi:uncharacterized protein YggL (DUF469 family)
MKSVKIGIVAAACLLTMNTFAQKQKIATKEVKTEKVERGEMTPEQMATRRTEFLDKKLTLSEIQKNKIYEINLNVNNKNKAVRDNAELSQQFKKDALKGNNESREYLIRETLTDEQKVKFDEMKAKGEESKEEHLENHEGHGHEGHSHN